MKTCFTCRWSAGWWLTKTGRVKRNSSAYCTYEVGTPPILPDAITRAYGFENWWPPHRQTIQKDGGSDCPCWEAVP